MKLLYKMKPLQSSEHNYDSAHTARASNNGIKVYIHYPLLIKQHGLDLRQWSGRRRPFRTIHVSDDMGVEALHSEPCIRLMAQ